MKLYLFEWGIFLPETISLESCELPDIHCNQDLFIQTDRHAEYYFKGRDVTLTYFVNTSLHDKLTDPPKVLLYSSCTTTNIKENLLSTFKLSRDIEPSAPKKLYQGYRDREREEKQNFNFPPGDPYQSSIFLPELSL